MSILEQLKILDKNNSKLDIRKFDVNKFYLSNTTFHISFQNFSHSDTQILTKCTDRFYMMPPRMIVNNKCTCIKTFAKQIYNFLKYMITNDTEKLIVSVNEEYLYDTSVVCYKVLKQ
uniref:Uncharacterized protein n=1 Tax=viral metagenome TaxID=1070528 RepID=A0A6C0CK58_9ZZZZ